MHALDYHRFLGLALPLLATVTIYACGDDAPPDEPPDAQSNDAGNVPDASNDGSVDAPTDDWPTFESDIVPIIETSCGAGDNACHSRVAYGANVNEDCRGWLSLENVPLGSEFYAGPDEGQPTGCPDMPLYERLTTLNAWQCEAFDPRMLYVRPCFPDESYLLRKTNGGPYCRNAMGEVTQPMPIGAALDPASIALISEWIAIGAPRDGEPLPDCQAQPVNAPEVTINHPSDGETRQADTAIPFIGQAVDVEDGDVLPEAMVWSSDREGQFGTGRDFQASLSMLGPHVITLTATDSDGNSSSASIAIDIAP